MSSNHQASLPSLLFEWSLVETEDAFVCPNKYVSALAAPIISTLVYNLDLSFPSIRLLFPFTS